MKYKIITPVVCLILILSIFSCVNKKKAVIISDKESIIKEIEKTIRNSIGWAGDKDIDLLYNTIANDSFYLEVHPEGDIVRGFEEFKKMEKLWLNPSFKAIGYNIEDLIINLSESGTVAWFYCKLDDLNEWDGQPVNWENTSWTGVLEKRDNNWRIVQMHFSYACEK